MGAINNIVNAGIDDIFGNSSGTTLQQFLSKFGSAEAKHVNVINPLATFEVNMKFYPTVGGDNKQSFLKSAVTGAVNNLGNNLTGGLLGSLFNNKKVITAHDEYTKKNEYTFMEYLANANLLVGGENWFAKQNTSPLELQLGFYVQHITIPNIKIPDDQKQATAVGIFPVNGLYVIPDNNTLQMDILCTKLPLHERIFYPWMREVTLPYWSYVEQPYTTAVITIDFSKHTDLKYIFTGCRPSQIHVIQPTQEPNAPITRQVSFLFDFMFIKSNLEVKGKINDMLLGAGKTLLNSTSKMINF